jgi:hypothetical protein
MGYTHFEDMAQFVSPLMYTKTAGTWTPSVASNLVKDTRTAAAAAFTLYIPILLPGSLGLHGCRVQSIDVWYKIATAAATSAVVPLMYQTNLLANAVAVTGSAIPVTLDALHDSSAELAAIGDHKMTITPTITVRDFMLKNTGVFLVFTVTAAATTVYTNFGAQINFTLRL